jgi:pilus assembly protein CpaC
MKKYSKILATIICLSLLSPLMLQAAKKKKHKGEYRGVKYEDVLVVMGITKELFFEFNVGDVRMPTNTSLVVPEIKRKAQNTEQKKDMIILVGKQEGFTDLWVYDDKKVLKIIYHIQVTKNDLKRIFRDVRNKLRDIEGVVIKIRDDKVFIGGELLLPTDIVKIIQVISTYPPVFILSYKVSPAVWGLIAEKMQKEINMPEVTVRVVNERFVLEGFVNNEEEKTYVVKRAALFLPKYYQVLPSNITGPGTQSAGELRPPQAAWLENAIIDDFLKIKAQPLDPDKDVKILIHFVEIAKGFEKAFDFQWGPGIVTGSDFAMNVQGQYSTDTSKTAPATLTNTISGTISNFIPKLSNTLNHNKGRVLQSAALTVRAGNNPGGDKQGKPGGSGTIKKMTSIPFTIPAAKAGDAPGLGSVDVGVMLEVKNLVIEGDKNTSKVLSMVITISVSSQQPGAGGMVGKASDDITTVVTINSGDTAAIGGIIQSLSDTNYGKSVPSNVNPIIDLSRSKNFSKKNTQFVVFVTPTIISTASEGSEEAKQRFRMNSADSIGKDSAAKDAAAKDSAAKDAAAKDKPQ